MRESAPSNLHNGKKYERVSAAERAKLNERIHVAGVFDGEFMSLFVDGKKQGRTVVSGRPKLSGFPLHLGANPQRKGPLVWQFGGTLHEVRISDSARYREDFERTRRFTPDKRTKALFHFDKGSGSVAYDSSGNNHNGRIHYARWHNSKDDAMYSAMGNASIRVGSEQRRSQAAAAIKATGANLHDSSEYSDWTTISIKYPANAKINVDAALEVVGRKLKKGMKFDGVSIDLRGTTVTDIGLEHLKEIPALGHLYLDGTKVTDAGLVHLKGHTIPYHLGLRNTRVTDAGLVHLKEVITFRGSDWFFPGFRKLDLGGTRITGTRLAHLQPLGLLQLSIYNTQVTDANLAHLTGLTTLRSLNLSGTRITSKGLEHLQPLTMLEWLNLSNTQVDDSGLVYLTGLTNLKKLNLKNTRVTDAGLKHLKGMPKLMSFA